MVAMMRAEAVAVAVIVGLACMAVGVVWIRKALQQPVKPFDGDTK